ncbi:hypothetical protein SS50377_20823 [Spironucleus salmonicida]|uniref:Uncharacterized protein n=1 Tax=Spironucleus salmonicida TaxID=348837 RepID=V6LGS7_9EUKA|nr:hypothetical protein SS50377_20823 [Spironucleus salmonicida]|eukprot:EST43513.1 Hypothetical protein SS50377_16547 [Spironucleus salmonicida]
MFACCKSDEVSQETQNIMDSNNQLKKQLSEFKSQLQTLKSNYESAEGNAAKTSQDLIDLKRQISLTNENINQFQAQITELQNIELQLRHDFSDIHEESGEEINLGNYDVAKVADKTEIFYDIIEILKNSNIDEQQLRLKGELLNDSKILSAISSFLDNKTVNIVSPALGSNEMYEQQALLVQEQSNQNEEVSQKQIESSNQNEADQPCDIDQEDQVIEQVQSEEANQLEEPFEELVQEETEYEIEEKVQVVQEEYIIEDAQEQEQIIQDADIVENIQSQEVIYEESVNQEDAEENIVEAEEVVVSTQFSNEDIKTDTDTASAAPYDPFM